MQSHTVGQMCCPHVNPSICFTRGVVRVWMKVGKLCNEEVHTMVSSWESCLHWSMEDSEELGVSTGCFPWHGSARLTLPFWSSLFPTVGLTSFPYHYLSWTSVEILSCVGNTFWDCECSCTGPLLSPLNYPFTLPFCIYPWHTSVVLNR